MKLRQHEEGYILVYTLMMIAVLMSIAALYFLTARTQIGVTRSAKNTVMGFYAGEAGLNLRADIVRQAFLGYTIPSGTAPSSTNPCTGTNLGSGDFACINYTFAGHLIKTWVEPEPTNPRSLVVPPGEKFAGLSTTQFIYTTHALAYNQASGQEEANLELKFQSRNIPLYQFAMFYNKDLTIEPLAPMTISGRVHSNFDVYTNQGSNANPNGLSFAGQLTAAKNIWRGYKGGSMSCLANSVRAMDPSAYQTLGNACGTGNKTRVVASSELPIFNGNVIQSFTPVSVPPISSWDPGPGHIYWDRADLRLALMLNASNAADTTKSTTGIVVISQSATSASQIDTAATTSLHACTGSLASRPIQVASFKNYWYSYPSGQNMIILDIDMQALFTCLKTTNWFGSGKLLSDATDGGLVIHATVLGPNSAALGNRYAVRLRNAAELKSTATSSPAILGMTFSTDQSLYTMGNFNTTNKKPVALLTDQYGPLSNQWNDANATYSARNVSAATTVNAAIVSGTGTTGGVDGVAGQGGTIEIAFLENLHENWASNTLNMVGAQVSLHRVNHGLRTLYSIGSPIYMPPTRVVTYDTSFNTAANLPPLSLKFVYLKEDLFIRDFEQ